MRYIFLLAVLNITMNVTVAQSWQSLRGGNHRNNLSPQYGLISTDNPIWTVNDAAYASFGGNVYTFGNRMVTSRYDISEAIAIVECRDIHTGELLWNTSDFGPAAKMLVTAINEDAVYCHDYNEETMIYYALHPETGEVKWFYPSYSFGPKDSPIFDCERNPVINTSLEEYYEDMSILRCVDKNTGETIWKLHESTSVLPNKVKAANDGKLYMITGKSNTPKQLMAINLSNGEILYSSEPIEGQAAQNSPPFIGPDGTIYLFRDGGDLFAFSDTGSGFELLWQYTPQDISNSQNPAIGPDGDIYYTDNGQVVRINHKNGQLQAVSSLNNLPLSSSILISRDSIIHIANGTDQYLALTYDLQTILWTETNNPNNTYAFPNLSYNGTMIMSGKGSTIKAFGNDLMYPPVAEFYASSYKINMGQSISFSDYSSYQPTNWQWTFEGGTPETSDQKYPVVTYNQHGIFSVKLIVSNEFGSDTLRKECYIDVNNTTWIQAEQPIIERLKIYPNPVKNRLTIDSKRISSGDSFQIISALGIVVDQDIVDQVPFTIDFSEIPRGIYFIKFQDHINLIQKVIKN